MRLFGLAQISAYILLLAYIAPLATLPRRAGIAERPIPQKLAYSARNHRKHGGAGYP